MFLRQNYSKVIVCLIDMEVLWRVGGPVVACLMYIVIEKLAPEFLIYHDIPDSFSSTSQPYPGRGLTQPWSEPSP